ncbi:MAG TPA: DUF4012 domain-containing protein [Marmoricola sp.]|nr:DUF4012 domain-containing protein [Marmoricola sp.]
MNTSLARLLSRRRILVAIGALFLVVVVAFFVEAVLAGFAMNAAKKDGDAVVAALNAGDLKGAQAAAAKLEKDARRAHSLTDDPLWWMGSQVPWLGNNVADVHDSAAALDAIANSSLPTLLHLANEVEHGSLRPHAGRIDPAAIAALAPSVRQAAAAIDGPATTVGKMSTSGLIPPLDSLMTQVKERVAQAKVAIDAAANAFQVLPAMLGGNGPRTYVLLVQNPAEIRSSGGLPGTWALIHADNGRLTMTSTTFLAALIQDTPPVPLTADESALFGSQFGTAPGDISQSPDFPRVAEIARAIERRKGVDVDAVFSVDPVALSYVLGGTGPVTLKPGLVLTAPVAVPFLMNQLYALNDATEQNTMFSLAARKTFDALVHGQGNQVNAIRGLVEGVMRHRVLAWSPDPDIAKVINGTGLSGAFPTNTGSTPQVGVYLNEGIAGKPDYYLRQSSVVTSMSCHSGVQTLKLQSSFQSTMPANMRQPWIVGTGEFAPRGHMLLVTYLAAPWQGGIDSITVNGVQTTVSGGQLGGRQIAVLSLDLAPGKLITVTATMHTGAGQSGDGKLTWTPGMSSDTNPSNFGSSC